jgi:hypothetical protein
MSSIAVEFIFRSSLSASADVLEVRCYDAVLIFLSIRLLRSRFRSFSQVLDMSTPAWWISAWTPKLRRAGSTLAAWFG